MNKPAWVLEKERLQQQEPEHLEMVGELGVAGVVDGKLPNGDDYDYLKKRDIRSRHRLQKIVDKQLKIAYGDNIEVPLDEN